MIAIGAALLLAFLSALALTPVVRRIALAHGTVEAPGTSYRKIHRGHIPRIGGIAIVIAFYVPLACLFLVDSSTGALFTGNSRLALALMLGGIPIVALGLYDDLFGANAVVKFSVQTGVALVLFAIGFRVEIVSLPFGSELALGPYALPLTLIWVVGLINALNLIDGLDGLAAGVAVVAASAIFVVALVNGNLLMMLFMAALVGSLLGFLVFNFNPATIFMGDTGSLFLGYVVAMTSLQTSTKGAATVALLTPLLALGLPILDTCMAFFRRIVRGQHPFQGDREHIHHRLLDMGFSHRGAVLVLYLVALAFAAFAITVAVTDGLVNALVIGAALFCIALLVYRMRLIVFDRDELAACRQRNRSLRRTQRRFAEQVSDASDMDRVFDALVDAMSDLQAAQIDLTPAPGTATRRWRRRGAHRETLVIERPIAATDGALRIAWDDGRTLLAAEDGSALDRMVQTMDRRVFSRLPQTELITSPRIA